MDSSNQPGVDSQGRSDRLLIHHFYHVYAAGAWGIPVIEHFAALKQAALCSIDVMTIGLVGSPAQRRTARERIDSHLKELCCPPRFVHWIEAETGWEQVTLLQLYRNVREADGELAVFYAHTKGAHDNSPENAAWRRSLTGQLIPGWQRCVELLADYDVVGASWMTQHGNWFFGANFWWARASYLRQLPEPANEHRYAAETWVTLALAPTCLEYVPGLPVPRTFDIAAGCAG